MQSICVVSTQVTIRTLLSVLLETAPVPDIVKIPMSQHIGKPCQPLVAKGDTVKVGQPIGDVDAS